MFGNQTAVFNTAHGHVFVGGTVSSNNPPFPAATAPQPTGGYAFPGSFATDIWAKMTGLSTGLLPLTSPSSVSGSTFTGVANGNGVAVFNITLAQLNAMAGTLSFQGCLLATNPGGPCDAVINVTNSDAAHTTFHQGVSYGALTAAQQNLIWNFEAPGTGVAGVTGVKVNGEWWASILAPGATVNNTAPIVGNLIANVFGGPSPLGSGELHDAPFDCSDNLCVPVPCIPGSPNCGPPLPEPGSLVVLASALVPFALLRYRRRRS